jgi:uncharacterized damage-inducible protein DinB
VLVVLDDAFAHHEWATLWLIHACLPLTGQQLDATVPGTYCSLLETMRHFVGGDEAGYVRDAPIGIRLAQAIHHGTDHRSQICTALTTLGVEPPVIDVWGLGTETGRVVDIPPTS